MANICLYKIKVKGTKDACYALINMMPLYSWEKDILSEEGEDDDYTLIFTGACKWSTSSYTQHTDGLVPYTPEQVKNVQDGDGWDICMRDKSLLLNCEIFCNSKDIDDSCYAVFEHYNRGKEIFDECPKELHIKRGRDYDQEYEIVNGQLSIKEEKYVSSCKVKFESGSYWYQGEVQLNDIVKVEGAKAGQIGKVVEIGTVVENNGLYKITEKLGNIGDFDEKYFENWWDSYKPKERKEHLKNIKIDEKVTKKKFLSIMEFEWIDFVLKNGNKWDVFVDLFGLYIKTPSQK